ncbi:hypothetical protein MSPP1_000166 [Malassezia sp. CBS 17886]|nr:hypothetical protein MSPP1_000166 [Malassezia sp. CBS 17886]
MRVQGGPSRARSPEPPPGAPDAPARAPYNLPALLQPARDAAAGAVKLAHLRRAAADGRLARGPPWVRTQAWKVLLGYLPEKKEAWAETLARRRTDYRRFLAEFSLDSVRPDTAAAQDQTLDEVYKDLRRACAADPAFYLRTCVWEPAASAPQTLAERHLLLRRLELVNRDFAREALQHGQAALSPRADSGALSYTDFQWHALLRILFLYAVLNPSIGYFQGMHEVLRVILAVFSNVRISTLAADDTAAQLLAAENPADIEADAFWCFSLFLGGLREVFDFQCATPAAPAARRGASPPPLVLPADTGLHQCLQQLRCRLEAADAPLAAFLRELALEPQRPYYAVRWLVCALSTEFVADGTALIWDALLAQDAEGAMSRLAFLLDLCCAMILHLREDLFQIYDLGGDSFQRVMHILQPYAAPQDAPQIIATAQKLRAARGTHACRDARAPTPPLLPAQVRRMPHEPPSNAASLPASTHCADAARSSSLQQRLAATVQRSLQRPPEPQRSSSWSTSDKSSVDAGLRPTLLRRYTEAFQESNAAASVSKVGTNLAARAISWRNGSPSPGAVPPTPPPNRPWGLAEPALPVPSVVDSPYDNDAHMRTPRGGVRHGIPSGTQELTYRSPAGDSSTSDDSFTTPSSPLPVTLPSMRAAARLRMFATPAEGAPAVTVQSPPLLAASADTGAEVFRRQSPCAGHKPALTRSPKNARQHAGSSVPATGNSSPLLQPAPALPMASQYPITQNAVLTTTPTSELPSGHTVQHLDALLAEFKSTEWITEK